MSLSQVWFSFEGRISRGTFWLKGILPYFVLGIVVGLVDVLAETNGILVSVLHILLIWPALAVSIKRWHDRDKSGWWVLISLIPLIGAIWAFIETGLLAGTPGPNRFGEESF